MSELRILRGVPASGKSTYALDLVKNEGWVRVNRDDLRFAAYGTYWGYPIDENVITKFEHAMITAALVAGENVVVDATNLNRKSVNAFLKIAALNGATVSYVDFPISIEEATRRDAARERTVGVDVLLRFFRRNKINLVSGALPPAPTPHGAMPQYVPNVTKPTAYGFDLDGTLALHNGRNPYDTSRYHEDSVNVTLLNIMHALNDRGEDELLILTGRSGEFRRVVTEWLNRFNVPYHRLYMRPAGDTRPDFIVKSELFDTYIAPNYNFLAQFDDRDQVVDGLRAKGVTVYQVAPGDF